MFSLVNGIYDAYFSPPKLSLLLVGGQGVGKTTLLERCKVTQFTKNKKSAVNLQQSTPLPRHVFMTDNNNNGDDNNAAGSARGIDIVEAPVMPRSKPKAAAAAAVRKSRWLCPAPQKYAVTIDDDADDDDDEYETAEMMKTLTVAASSSSVPPMPSKNGVAPRKSSTQGSMESVQLGDDDGATATPLHPTAAAAAEALPTDYDLKPSAKMLPFTKIRPTIGMNLAKNLDICGAKCNVLDLGGRLVDLWERYYNDCDAVVFVWKLNSNNDSTTPTDSDNTDDDDSDDGRPVLTPQQQLRLLEKVRSSIPDDIPFLVLGHYDTDVAAAQYQTDTLYSTSQLLPHYHNPLQALFFCNVGTGQGVRSAMEWLIPLAKRQQAVRDKTAVSDELEKVNGF